MSCQNRKKNLPECNCTYPCSRHGVCCECIAYHNRAGEFPACFFSDQTEKTYDRSLAALLRDREQK